MTICPIAIAVGCKKCPAFKFCPLTTVLGDQQEKVDKIESDERMGIDEYQRYAEEELEKNTKQMESFKGEDAEVIPENKKLTKDERLALIKESAEKKSFDERLRNRGR